MSKFPIIKTYLIFWSNILIFVSLFILWINFPFHYETKIIDPFDIKLFYILLILCYLLIIFFNIYNEIFYSKNFKDIIKYSDLTLEFLNLDEKYNTEEKILNLFNNLTNNNILEISLVYNLSDYFLIIKELEIENDNLKKEILIEKLNNFKQKFKNDKEKYFINRGYITFKDYKYAYEFKELYNKIKYGFLFSIFKRKNINTDYIKYFKENIKNSKFIIKRGIDPELLNFDFNLNKIMKKWKIILYSIIILIIIPSISFYINIKYYRNFINYNDNFISKKQYFLDYFYTFLIVIIDQIAFFLIDLFLSPKKFFKNLNLYSYKFYFFNIYILLANIILPTYSMKLTYLDFIKSHNNNKIKKLLIKSLYFNYYLVVFSMVNYKILKPLLYYVIKNISQNKKIINFAEYFHDESLVFSFSYITTCLMYISFYCYITPKVIIILFLSLILLLTIDFFNRKNKRLEKLFPINLLGNFWSYLAISLFPSLFIGRFLITPTFMYNKYLLIILKLINYYKPINFFNIEGFYVLFSNIMYIFVNDFFLSVLLIIYFILIFFFINFNNNDIYLKRIQSRIWNYKKNTNNMKIIGKSYRDLNPVYTIINY